MKQFNTLLKAAEFAVTLAASWQFATSERYDKKGLLGIAEVSDAENPPDEYSFYVVSPGGAIGFCEDGEDIDWLFLTDAAPNEDLPLIFQTATQVKFCTKCASGVAPGARFCGKCGNRL